jgi:hypothetical protein
MPYWARYETAVLHNQWCLTVDLCRLSTPWNHYKLSIFIKYNQKSVDRIDTYGMFMLIYN